MDAKPTAFRAAKHLMFRDTRIHQVRLLHALSHSRAANRNIRKKSMAFKLHISTSS